MWLHGPYVKKVLQPPIHIIKTRIGGKGWEEEEGRYNRWGVGLLDTIVELCMGSYIKKYEYSRIFVFSCRINTHAYWVTLLSIPERRPSTGRNLPLLRVNVLFRPFERVYRVTVSLCHFFIYLFWIVVLPTSNTLRLLSFTFPSSSFRSDSTRGVPGELSFNWVLGLRYTWSLCRRFSSSFTERESPVSTPLVGRDSTPRTWGPRSTRTSVPFQSSRLRGISWLVYGVTVNVRVSTFTINDTLYVKSPSTKGGR